MTQQRKQNMHQPILLLPFLLVCVYFLRICASDSAHVFMHSGRTGAACNSSPACRSKEHSRCSDVSPRENKQNRVHFIQDGGTVKIRADPLRIPPHPPKTGTPLCGSQVDLSWRGQREGCFARCLFDLQFKRIKVFTRDFMHVCSQASLRFCLAAGEVNLQEWYLRSERCDRILRAQRGAGVNSRLCLLCLLLFFLLFLPLSPRD